MFEQLVHLVGRQSLSEFWIKPVLTPNQKHRNDQRPGQILWHDLDSAVHAEQIMQKMGAFERIGPRRFRHQGDLDRLMGRDLDAAIGRCRRTGLKDADSEKSRRTEIVVAAAIIHETQPNRVPGLQP